MALVYGAVGGAVARSFAREGATLYVASRTEASLVAVAKDIDAAGGSAQVGVVDASDERAVEAHVANVAAQAGRIDVLFNAIGVYDIQGTPLVDLALDDLMQPIVQASRTQFLTAHAVGRRMILMIVLAGVRLRR